MYVILPMIGAVVPIWFRKDRVKAGWAAAAILFLTTLHVLAFGQDLDTLSFIMALFIPAIGTVNPCTPWAIWSTAIRSGASTPSSCS